MELKQKLNQLCAEYGLSRSQLAQMLDESPKIACFKDRMGEQFSRDLQVEYRQCIEEGLDVRAYEALFDAVDKMPVGDHRDAAGLDLREAVRGREGREREQQRTEPAGVLPVRERRRSQRDHRHGSAV